MSHNIELIGLPNKDRYMALCARKYVCPGTVFLNNDFIVENEIQIGELMEDKQGIFVSL